MSVACFLISLGCVRPLARMATCLPRLLPWTPDGKALEVHRLAGELMARHTSDDFLFIYLVVVNQFVTTVPLVGAVGVGVGVPCRGAEGSVGGRAWPPRAASVPLSRE